MTTKLFRLGGENLIKLPLISCLKLEASGKLLEWIEHLPVYRWFGSSYLAIDDGIRPVPNAPRFKLSNGLINTPGCNTVLHAAK